MARRKAFQKVRKAHAKNSQRGSITPEEFFGLNAGKVWIALERNRTGLSIQKIVLITGLSMFHAWGALGWLGREGKLRIENGKFFLNE